MKIEKIKDIEFFDREREIKEIMQILESEPRVINFIYGPINSGKTTLIQKLIDDLSGNDSVFYINLRGRLIKEYEEFVRVLFSVKKESALDVLKGFIKKIFGIGTIPVKYFTGVPVEKWVIDDFFKSKTPGDVFEFLENYFKEISKKGRVILIIDELQVIGDLKIDGKLIYKLFNFFIRLTKELHICHVFAVSSDSLFIETVYSEAMLQGRTKCILIDDFDYETSRKFLEKYNFNRKEIEFVLENIGGKPSFLREIIDAKINKPVDVSVKELLKLEKSKIKEVIRFVRNYGDKVEISDKQYGIVYEKVVYEDVVETLSKFIEKDKEYVDNIKDIPKRYLVNKNILFFDPVEDIVKPQSKVDLIAIREILDEMKKRE